MASNKITGGLQLVCSRPLALSSALVPQTLSSGWSRGSMVLGKLSVPGRPTNLDFGRARDYCAESRCGRGLFGHFSRLSLLSSFSLSLGDGPI